METEYLGYKITYFEDDEEFRANIDGVRKKSGSLKSLKKQIDNILNPKVKFKRVPCFFYDHWSSFTEGFITSIAENRYGSQEVWTINSKKQRSKNRVGNCFLDTKDNRLKIEQHKSLKERTEELQKKTDAIMESMETYKIKINE